ncbi:unnamed protein product [Ectocarpus sp. CCAP 1310/34]|nr:unnamed protein product [Ectocarpus sp. CCAP 1310/34]
MDISPSFSVLLQLQQIVLTMWQGTSPVLSGSDDENVWYVPHSRPLDDEEKCSAVSLDPQSDNSSKAWKQPKSSASALLLQNSTRDEILRAVQGRKELQLFLDDANTAVLCVWALRVGDLRLDNGLELLDGGSERGTENT